MEQLQTLEGTWEDIKQHDQELSGRWLKVIVEAQQDQSPVPIQQTPPSNGQTSTAARPLRGRGMFKGKLGGTEALLQQKHADIKREEQRF